VRICCLATQTVAHVIGGMAQQTYTLAVDLARLGHDVSLITTAHPAGLERDAVDGVTVQYLPRTTPASQTKAWWRESAGAFRRLHGATPVDVVWSQSVAGAAVARMLDRRAPAFVPIIHGTAPAMVSSLVSAMRRARARPAVATSLKRLARQVVNYTTVDHVVYRRADVVIAVSRAVAASVRRWYRVPAARIAVVANAIDPEMFRPRPERRAALRAAWGAGDGETVLLTVGILSDQKGVDVAIEALARLKARGRRARLVVVGDGPLRPALARLASARGVTGAVTFVGALANEEAAAYYGAADVFVFPTLRVEAFGVVTIEAMAAQRPVIVSRIGATPEIVEDGVTGFLVPPGDVEAVAARIALLADDPVRARAMGQRGRARVVAEWTREAQARRIVEVFESVRRP
jgi:glycosyltransferase involved in cell wall biosynthesis